MTTDYVAFLFASSRRHTIDIGDWSSEVCSSDLGPLQDGADLSLSPAQIRTILQRTAQNLGKNGYDALFNFGLVEIGRASCRERGEIAAVLADVETEERVMQVRIAPRIEAAGATG